QALLARDPAYQGLFYVGVKTTSICCISTCRARKPKLKNTEYFPNLKEALQHGYRPCKVCKPDESTPELPADIVRVVQLVKQHPKEKISDQRLREIGIQPSFVRRWFQRHYGLTFHAYQRMFRINIAYQEIRAGQSATDTAFDNGYESLSGFGYTYKKLLGQSPKQSVTQNVLLLSKVSTPLGPMFICASEKGICLLEFTDRRMLETEFKDLQHLLKATILFGENEHTKQLKKELAAYFDGTSSRFQVTLDQPGSDFQRQVWSSLREIPPGTTTSYQALAEQIGRPTAYRAVARANGFNRLAIVVPCHRVLGKDGSLTGYGGGLARKEWLLAHEERVF
ncbi:MAG: methylated-DNA--[protein]-cysteine S-methyltransferase, partial [Bacteroidota bacterium]